MNVKKISKNIFSGVLSLSQVAVDGLSSAREIVDFTPAPWAKYASCSASIVEGEIYRKNIIEGFTRCKLGKKALLKFLVIQKFEAELVAMEQYEKELGEKLHDFFIKIKDEQIEHKLNKKEQENLDECITLFEENKPLNDETLNKLTSCFRKLRNARDGISCFVNFHLAQVPIFEPLEKRIEILKKKREESDCTFLTSYQANKNFLKNAKTLKLSESEIKEVNDRLKCLKKTLIDCVAYTENWQFLHIPTEAPSLIESNEEDYVSISYVKDTQKKTPVINPHLVMKLQKELPSAKLKLGLLRFSMLFSVASGVAIGVVTFYTFPAVLMGLGLGLSLTALSAVLWPLAILAAISYGMLIYNTLADLTINETLSKWWRNFKKEIEQGHGKLHFFKYALLVIAKTLSQFFFKLINWLKPQKQEGWFKYSVRIVLGLLVISFGVIAALATGYTAFSQLHEYVSVVVCIITALPLLISDFIFTLKNSFESIGLLTAISFANLRDPALKALKTLKDQMLTENPFQLALHLMRLPLKLLLEVFKLAIFICHVVFISVASDRLFNFPCWLAFIFSCGSELLTDICPLFGKDKGHHDHNHGGLFNWLGKLIFIAPATLFGVLNCVFSQLNHLFSDSDRKALSLREAIKQEYEQFDILHSHTKKEQKIQSTDIDPVQARQLPREIVLQKSIKICDKQIKRLEHGFFNSRLVQEKKEVFKQYKTELVKAYQQGSTLPFLAIKNRKKLGEHRIFNRAKKTESMRQLYKLQRWFNVDKDYNALVQCNEQTNGYANAPLVA